MKNKTVIITGASSGIGAATAREFAAKGAKVVLAARRSDRIQALCDEIKGTGAECLAVACDVTDAGQVDELFSRTKKEFGPVDVLVNNAGIMLLGRFERGLRDEWQKMEDLNVVALFYASYKAIEHMREAGGGVIVHISSTAGRVSRPLAGAYAASKAAVLAAAESMRQELINDNIRICSIIPGAVATELTEHSSDEEAKGALAGITKMKRLEPEDLARSILFAADQPDYVSINEILIRPTVQPF